MAEKLLILASLVISQGKGMIKYYNDEGAIATVKSKEAQIVDELPAAEPETDGFENPSFSDEDPVIEPSGDEEDEAAVGSNPEELATEDTELQDAELDAIAEAEADAGQDSQQEEDDLPATPVVQPRGKEKIVRMTTVKAQAKPANPVKVAPKKTAPAKVAAKTAAGANKKAAPSKSNGHTAPNTIRTIAGREHDISGYVKTKSPSGVVSFDNGDTTAEKLRDKTLDQVYDIVAKALKEDVKTLRAKYKHLNSGMQRMTLGNRMRKIVRAKEASASA